MKIVVLVLAAAFFLPLLSSAQVASGAASLLVDPSIRASGMGRASTAVFWGDDPNYWANPALLGYHRGIRYEWGKTQLVPGLASDVFFESERWTVGAFGIGVSIAGKPSDIAGKLRLDYGVSMATDEQGEPVGTFQSWEEVHSKAIGINVVETAENLLGFASVNMPDVSRFADLSLGWTEKRARVFLAPASVTLDGQEASAGVTTRDHGYLVRLTPFNSLDGGARLHALDRALEPYVSGARIDFSYGRGVQNSPDALIAYINQAQVDPIAREDRKGWAARAAIGLPAPVHEAFRGHGWFERVVTPFISFGYASDRLTESAPRFSGGRYESKIDYTGWELTFANIWTIRHGHVNDPDGTVIGDTNGWGLGLRLGDVAGFRYDRARVPQSVHLEHDVTRKGYQTWFDFVALWREAKSAAEARRR